MKYYLMARKVRENSTLLDQVSHELVEFSTGNLLPDNFEEPFVVELDEEFIDGDMATFYMDPAIIGTKAFYQDLLKLGVDNIEVKQVVIQDNVNDKTNHDYLLMNIIGRVSCADMEASDYAEIGEGINVINKLVIDPSKVRDLSLFLVNEDTDCIVVNEHIYTYLKEKKYPDIYFEELEQM